MLGLIFLKCISDAFEAKHAELEADRKTGADPTRVLVKRILGKHGHPPDKQEKATQTVLEQAEVLSAAWAV